LLSMQPITLIKLVSQLHIPRGSLLQ
jgi:hypothetical protein